MDIFARIKRLVIRQRIIFTEKAETEMYIDHLSHLDIAEAILNAPSISKILHSRNPRTRGREKLYVIEGLTYDGLSIYTKGKFARFEGQEVFYVLISSKRSTDQ